MFKNVKSSRGRFATGLIQATVSAVLAVAVSPAWSATREVRLSVPGMTCAACPITVRKALSRVEGVSRVDVDYAQQEAVVTFDDSRTDARALTEATRDAGYPSIMKPQP